MNLCDIKFNTPCVVTSIDVVDEKVKIRLMELGIIEGTKILVKKKSILKKNLLISFNSACFTIGENVAREIKVKYV